MVNLLASPIDPNYPEDYKMSEAQFSDTGQQNWNLNMRSHAWRPSADIYETEEALIVRVEIAGMQENDFGISISGRKLTIQGNRPDLQEKRAYYLMEIHSGEFLLEIDLPFSTVNEQVEAYYENGFLRICLPKAIPRQIPIHE